MINVLAVIRDSQIREKIRGLCGWNEVITTANPHKGDRIIVNQGMPQLIVIEQKAAGMTGAQFLVRLRSKQSSFDYILVADDERQRGKLID